MSGWVRTFRDRRGLKLRGKGAASRERRDILSAPSDRKSTPGYVGLPAKSSWRYHPVKKTSTITAKTINGSTCAGPTRKEGFFRRTKKEESSVKTTLEKKKRWTDGALLKRDEGLNETSVTSLHGAFPKEAASLNEKKERRIRVPRPVLDVSSKERAK